MDETLQEKQQVEEHFKQSGLRVRSTEATAEWVSRITGSMMVLVVFLLIWLGLVVLLSAVAGLLPARNAMRLTVREVLVYE